VEDERELRALLARVQLISPRAPRKRPVPPVIARVLSFASKNGPSTVIWPPSSVVVKLHS